MSLAPPGSGFPLTQKFRHAPMPIMGSASMESALGAVSHVASGHHITLLAVSSSSTRQSHQSGHLHWYTLLLRQPHVILHLPTDHDSDRLPGTHLTLLVSILRSLRTTIHTYQAPRILSDREENETSPGLVGPVCVPCLDKKWQSKGHFIATVWLLCIQWIRKTKVRILIVEG